MISGQGLPVHPFTGLQAIGIKKNGDYIWPIMGGDENNDPKPGSAEPLVEGGNPAWNDYLKYVPEEQRPEVVPVLQQWDQGVQEKIQQVQSEYEPWKDFVKSGIDPETAQFATEVLAKMQEDPRAIYDSLGQHFQWHGEEGTGTTEGKPSGQGLENGEGEEGQFEFDLEKNPAFQQLQQQNKLMADFLLAQRNEQLEQQQEVLLDKEFKQAEEKFGKFDKDANDFVLMYMAQNDVSVEDAATAYYDFLERKGGRRPAPKLHGGSGGGAAPAPKLSPKKMSDKEARDAFVQMLTSGPEG